MERHKAQARLLEALLAALLITSSLIVANSNFLKHSYGSSLSEKSELASKALQFLLYKGILFGAYEGNFLEISNVLEEIIPRDHGFKISVYDLNFDLIWSYKRANYNEGDADSSFLITNGYNGLSNTNILIFVLSVS